MRACLKGVLARYEELRAAMELWSKRSGAKSDAGSLLWTAATVSGRIRGRFEP